ncbi:MAG: right-handed parallel beta-helix repeat-containing protein, partial [Pseudomonadota bacterium]
MATITVDIATDELDGSIFDGDISLRDALAAASSGDVITFDSGVFTADDDPLNNTTIFMLMSNMNIGVDVLINGDVDGDGIADVRIDTGLSDGVFVVDTANVDLEVHGLALVNSAGGGRGAISIDEATSTLTVSNSLFLNNQSGSAQGGGAIKAEGEFTIVNSYFSENSGDEGGAILALNDGTIVNSTFTKNSADIGGAINVAGSGTTVDLINSSLTGNQANNSGGGISSGGALSISNSIVLGNQAGTASTNDIDGTLTSNGANIFGNSVSGAPGDLLLGVASMSSVFQSVGPVTVGGVTFDAGLVTRTTGINPVVELSQGGIAIDAGDNSAVPSEAGLGFDVDRDGTIETGPLERDASIFSRIIGGVVDIGAAENNNGVWVVDSTSDVDDGDVTIGNLSLREAVNNAADGDLITFDAVVFNADADERANTEIFLTGGRLRVDGDRELTINGDVDGDGIADVTIDGSLNSNVGMLYLANGSSLNAESMTFANGDDTNSGGAILSLGDLSVLNSTFTANSGSNGGALNVLYSGTATIANSTFDLNYAAFGGAIYVFGDVTLVNSTLYQNASGGVSGGLGGGAVQSYFGNVTLQNSTVTGNTSSGSGGGINLYGGSLNLENSIVVGNTDLKAGSSAYTSDILGSGSPTATSNSGNVTGDVSGVTVGGISGASPIDVFDSLGSSAFGGTTIFFGALGNDGGPTDTVLSLQGGLAADQGISADLPTESSLGLDVNGDGAISGTVDVDQRGEMREIGPSVDSGAVELDTSLIIVTTTEDTRDGDTSLDDISWREALDLVIEGGRIEFDPTLFAVDSDPLSNTVIQLTNGGEKGFSKAFHLDGDINDDGIADVTFDGAGPGNDWMEVATGTGLITLEGLTFQRFTDVGSGGVILSNADLFILNSNFIDNTSQNFGGALRLNNASNTIISGSYFSGNSAYGGGALSSFGNTTIVGSTFTENLAFFNVAGGYGGAIDAVNGTLRMINSTLTGNFADQLAGGIYGRYSTTVSISNSIIAGNAAGVLNNDLYGTFNSNGANIFGAGQTGAALGDVVLGGGQDLADVFDQTGNVTVGGATFQAGLPAENGGGPTVALSATNASNPALDAGDPAALDENILGVDLNFDGDTLDMVIFDGRGFSRYIDLPGIGSTIPDIGAFEVQDISTLGPDIATGTSGIDLILLNDGGADSVSGLEGNDALFFGAEFDSRDVVDGGGGDFDQLGLQGDYSGGVTFGENGAMGIEAVILLPGNITAFGAPGTEFYDYNFTLVDANVGAGEELAFQANQLRAGEDFTLDASAETDGSIFTFAGLGAETITGSQNDDSFFFGTGRFGPDDRLDGNTGAFDSVGLQGDYSTPFTIGPDQLVNIDILALLSSTDPRFGVGGGTLLS